MRTVFGHQPGQFVNPAGLCERQHDDVIVEPFVGPKHHLFLSLEVERHVAIGRGSEEQEAERARIG